MLACNTTIRPQVHAWLFPQAAHHYTAPRPFKFRAVEPTSADHSPLPVPEASTSPIIAPLSTPEAPAPPVSASAAAYAARQKFQQRNEDQLSQVMLAFSKLRQQEKLQGIDTDAEEGEEDEFEDGVEGVDWAWWRAPVTAAPITAVPKPPAQAVPSASPPPPSPTEQRSTSSEPTSSLPGPGVQRGQDSSDSSNSSRSPLDSNARVEAQTDIAPLAQPGKLKLGRRIQSMGWQEKGMQMSRKSVETQIRPDDSKALWPPRPTT